MRKRCLDISDAVLLDKLECFIYEYSGLKYNDFEIEQNYNIGNRADDKKLKNIGNRYKLREMPSCNITNVCLDEKELENTIELFLLFMRTYDIEACICLEALLDAIRRAGKAGTNWRCVKRVNGIFASVYLLYFSNDAKLFDKKNTEVNMKCIFERNIEFYNLEDKRFLNQLFINEKRYDCLIEMLRVDLKSKDEREVYDTQLEYQMADEFFAILKDLKRRGKYYDALDFWNEGKSLFKNITENCIKDDYEKKKAGILFDLRKFEEAKAIQDKYINNVEETGNIYDLYNGAVYYAWAANYKEKNDPEWKEYIERAYKLIERIEQIILCKKNKKSLTTIGF